MTKNIWYLDDEISIESTKNISIQFGISNITKKEMRKIIPIINTISKKESTSIEITPNNITIYAKNAYLTYNCIDYQNRHILCCIEDKNNGYYFISGPSKDIKIYYYEKEKLQEMRNLTNTIELIPSQFEYLEIFPNLQIDTKVETNEELACLFASIIDNTSEYINELIENKQRKTKIKIKRH